MDTIRALALVLGLLPALLPAQSDSGEIFPSNLHEEPAPAPTNQPVVSDLETESESPAPDPTLAEEETLQEEREPDPESASSVTGTTPPEDAAPLTVEEVVQEIVESEQNAPQSETPPNRIPPSYGDTSGPAYIGHRAAIERYAGWGWIKSDGSAWNRSQWVVLEEVPRTMPAPGRFLEHPDNDNNYRYRLYGQWMDYQAYEPNFDIFVPVFKLKGFELVGPASRPGGLRLPRGTAMSGQSRAVPGGGGARDNPFSR